MPASQHATAQQRRWHSPPQTDKTPGACSCIHWRTWRTWASWGSRAGTSAASGSHHTFHKPTHQVSVFIIHTAYYGHVISEDRWWHHPPTWGLFVNCSRSCDGHTSGLRCVSTFHETSRIQRSVLWASFSAVGWCILGTGTRQDIFHNTGTLWMCRCRLKRCWNTLLSWLEHALSTREWWNLVEQFSLGRATLTLSSSVRLWCVVQPGRTGSTQWPSVYSLLLLPRLSSGSQ